MRSNRWIPVSLLLLAGLSCHRARKQLTAHENRSQPLNSTTAKASISGSVSSASAAPLPGAQVTLVAGDRASHLTAVTDGRGHFAFDDVEPGAYTIEVERAGYQNVSHSNVVVDSKQESVFDFVLVPEAQDAKTSQEFDYYDKTEFKPGSVSASVDPGGYSAAKEVDSYSLMLDYAAVEGAAPSSRPGASPAPPQGQDNVPASPPTTAELGRWTESQFLAQGSARLLSHAIAASVDIFQAGVARFPDSVKLHTGLGIALTARGDYEKAIASLLRATDLAPSDPQPYFVLAKAYAGSPRPTGEVPKRLERLVALDPRNPQALYYYALVLEKGSGTDQAVLVQAESLLQRSVALDPNFADAHLQLGIVYAARSHDADAIREYQAAVKLKPSLAAAHYRLAQAYARTGKKEAAQSELDLYQRLRKPASSPH